MNTVKNIFGINFCINVSTPFKILPFFLFPAKNNKITKVMDMTLRMLNQAKLSRQKMKGRIKRAMAILQQTPLRHNTGWGVREQITPRCHSMAG